MEAATVVVTAVAMDADLEDMGTDVDRIMVVMAMDIGLADMAIKYN